MVALCPTSGITSSSALLDLTHSRALGYADGNDGIVATVAPGQTLIKSTIVGDADLSGR